MVEGGGAVPERVRTEAVTGAGAEGTPPPAPWLTQATAVGRIGVSIKKEIIKQ